MENQIYLTVGKYPAMEIKLVEAGLLFILVGFAFVIIGGLTGSQAKGTKVAVGGFIGPIPFGFANDPRMLKIVIGISVAVLILFFILPLLMRYLR